MALVCLRAGAEDAGGPRWAAVPREMQSYVDRGEISGAVTLVAGKDGVLALDAVGMADVSAGTPMRPDSIFAIASMTKLATATAVMMLVDEGKIAVDDPVGKYVPQLAHLNTPDGVEHTVTVRQLLTHTSGMAELTREQAAGARTLADLIPHYADQPLLFEPGSRWKYCQSAINTLARIAELASGEPFADYLERHLFAPLGMKDSTFYPTPEQIGRIAKLYKRAAGKLEEVPLPFGPSHDPAARDYYPAANGGLYSTAADYGRFMRMVLNRGELEGRRYLKADTVQTMTHAWTEELKAGFAPGEKWGLGWCVVTEPQGINAMLSRGTCGHGGAFGTVAWVDWENGRAYVLMVPVGNFNSDDPKNARVGFQRAVMQP